MPNFIAHRGNTEGPSPLENTPEHLIAAMKKGYSVEMDVWVDPPKPSPLSEFDQYTLWLGHDGPSHEFTLKLLGAPKFYNVKAYLHAKDFQTFDYLLRAWGTLGLNDTNYDLFYHTTEDFVLTKNGKYWIHPNFIPEMLNTRNLHKENHILVMPELNESVTLNYDGRLTSYTICTDYVEKIMENMHNYHAKMAAFGANRSVMTQASSGIVITKASDR